ncbi:hypothetical protein AUC43_13000 [Hymenobacter sedentarius]|uniref:Uncharacterized protein n=1 Tax=Hymenobacter sedentarius TaxID=1411621 RepID=A0A0U4AYX4_9BACT|nr:hypothetical protein [Hymenobacter sedentarius]ALW85933.1 hypothetical protein AUC43_13000 [Hymenobacter sedentarius]
MSIPQKKIYTIYLPIALVNAIDAMHIDGVRRTTAIQIVWSILLCQKRAFRDEESFVTIPRSYFLAISSNCYRALTPLKEVTTHHGAPQAIVEVERNAQGKESYSKDKSRPKGYRVNPKFLKGPLVTVTYTGDSKRRKQRTLSAQMHTWLQSDSAQLTIEGDEARRYTNDYVSNLDLQEWRVDDTSAEYRDDEVLIDVRFGTRSKTYNCKTRALLKKLHQAGNGEQVFRAGKGGFVVATASEFKRRKVDDILRGWKRAIRGLEENSFEPERVSTNNRLVTQLTEFPKQLLPFVLVDGVELEEVDIANSQVAFLVFVLEHGDILGAGLTIPPLTSSPETRRFFEEAKAGTIYQDFARCCGRERDWGKREIFRLLFSSNPAQWPSWKKFVEQYGAVATWLLEFNRVNQERFGNEDAPRNLAVYLQRLEADIMIDRVYPRLKQAELTAFTKHDSLLCPPWDCREATAIMKQVFAEVGFEAVVSIKPTIHPPVAAPIIQPSVTLPWPTTPTLSWKASSSNELLSEDDLQDLLDVLGSLEESQGQVL